MKKTNAVCIFCDRILKENITKKEAQKIIAQHEKKCNPNNIEVFTMPDGYVK